MEGFLDTSVPGITSEGIIVYKALFLPCLPRRAPLVPWFSRGGTSQLPP